MDQITWHNLYDKSTWGPGPWVDEPDKEQWPDEETGIACLIVRNDEGALCGYVGIPPGHPWHQVSCWDIPSESCIRDLTYSRRCQPGPGPTICHIAADGDPDPLWWIGFHCASAWDRSPALFYLSERLAQTQRYRTIDYVKNVCALLATAAKEAEGGPAPEAQEAQTTRIFTCPCCGTRSPHPKDVKEGYCEPCHAFTGDDIFLSLHQLDDCSLRAANESAPS